MSPNTMKELTKADVSLKTKQDQLVKSQKVLARKNRELSETNRVLALIARKLDQNKKATAREMALTIACKVLPIVDKLRNANDIQECRTDLDILSLYLKELMTPLDKGEKIIVILSATEMKVATMIKNGMTTPQIAKELFICEDTVKTHRRNIRRKLGFKNARIDLKNYLRLKWDEIASHVQR